MAHRYVIFNYYGNFCRPVDHTSVLDISSFADGNKIDISPQHGPEPYAGIPAQSDISHKNSGGGHKGRLRCLGRIPIERQGYKRAFILHRNHPPLDTSNLILSELVPAFATTWSSDVFCFEIVCSDS